MAIHDAVEDEIEDRVDDLLELQVDAAAVRLDAGALVTEHRLLVIAVAGEDVQMHRHLEILGRRPELLVVVGPERQVRVRRLPDERALEPRLGAALQFLDRLVDVVHGDGRHPHQPVGRHRAIVHHPVVVGAKRHLLKLGVVHGEMRQQIGREEDLPR